AVALGPPTTHPLGFRAPADALVLYLSTTLPAGEAVAVMPDFGIGLAARDGTGLAYVTGRFSSVRRVTAITAHGSEAPCRKLQRAIGKWDALGRPGVDAL